MSYIYTLEQESTDELLATLAKNMQRRRLEKGLSRNALSMMSGVPAPTIAKFEQQHTISLLSFVALAQALGHTEDIKRLLAEPHFATMEDLERINKNKNRKRGHNEIG